MNLTRTLSRRVKRLEDAQQANPVGREAYIEPSPLAGPMHLELNGSPR
jgi:hypothetical protein